MNDETKPAPHDEEEPAPAPPGNDDAGEAVEETAAEDAAANEAEALREELAALNDRLLRTAAELENVRRRGRKDLEDARKFAARGFAEDMLAVADNLSRALEAVAPEARREGAAAGLIEGVELTMRALDGALRRHGVEAIEALGARFDPNLHQAMFEAESAEVEPGAVMQVLRGGYTIHGRLLRPAMVGVAKAPAPAGANRGEEEGEAGA